MSDDISWMKLALSEARKGIGRTAPNPPVGAVIVKNGELLGSGWHRAAGQPHAEREAIADVIEKHTAAALHGATIYITLEPCSTFGRTPPCTQGLIDAKIARVVYACVDRNPHHIGQADRLLNAAGIEVVVGVCRIEAEHLLRAFFKVQQIGLPWLIWKTAMSLDGRITRPLEEGQWLTSPAARADVQQLRATVDAILTSGETIRRDQPALTIRQPELLAGREQPWRVIFTDQAASLPPSEPRERTLIRPRAGIDASLRQLVSEQGILSVMVEAGGTFSALLFETGLIDEVVIYYAPLLCGGPTAALAGTGLKTPLKLKNVEFTQLGNDIRLCGIV